MTKLIENIFKKTKGITKSDLENEIIGADENLELEFKTIYPDQPKSAKKNTIIDPLVSILNSSTGHGLLVLGIKTKKKSKTAEKIRGIDKNIDPCKSVSQLDSTIKSYISSVPPFSKNFRLDVITVDIGDDKNVFLIEIERKDKNCVYYSQVNFTSHERVDDEDNGISMEKFYDLVFKKTYPKISIDFSHENHPNELLIRPKYVNNGYKPGKNVYTVFIGCGDKDPEINKTPHIYGFGGNVKQHKNILKTLGLLNEINQYNEVNFFTTKPSKSDHLGPDLIYPHHFSPPNIGIFFLKSENPFKYVFYIIIYEETCLTTQKVTITRVGNNVTIKNDYIKFKPYITIS